jgi:hypothetical protein
MKAHDPRADSDPKLRALLRESLPPSALPPRFAESVWRRIERSEALDKAAPPGASWLDHLAAVLLRPKLALAVAAVVLAVSAALGFLTAAGDAQEAARDTYLTAVTPYAKPPQS